MKEDDKESNHTIVGSNQQNDGSSVLDSLGYHLVTNNETFLFLSSSNYAFGHRQTSFESDDNHDEPHEHQNLN